MGECFAPPLPSLVLGTGRHKCGGAGLLVVVVPGRCLGRVLRTTPAWLGARHGAPQVPHKKQFGMLKKTSYMVRSTLL